MSKIKLENIALSAGAILMVGAAVFLSYILPKETRIEQDFRNYLIILPFALPAMYEMLNRSRNMFLEANKE